MEGRWPNLINRKTCGIIWKENNMIGYVTIGTNDKKRAEKFYDELLKEIGGSRFMEN